MRLYQKIENKTFFKGNFRAGLAYKMLQTLSLYAHTFFFPFLNHTEIIHQHKIVLSIQPFW